MTATATSPPLPPVVQLSGGNSDDGDGSNGKDGDDVTATMTAAQMMVGDNNIQQSTKSSSVCQWKQRWQGQ